MNFIKLHSKYCHLCQIKPSIGTIDLCFDCFKELPLVHETFIKSDVDSLNTSITAVCQYTFPIQELILAYKNQQNLSLSPLIVQLFLTLPRPDDNSLLVPMPASKQSLRKRGFDHIDTITKRLSHHWQLPIWRAIKHKSTAKEQKGLNRQQRMHNMQDQFEITNLPPTGKQLIIIDDICTTGSTIGALAKCLKQTGLPTQAFVLAYKIG